MWPSGRCGREQTALRLLYDWFVKQPVSNRGSVESKHGRSRHHACAVNTATFFSTSGDCFQRRVVRIKRFTPDDLRTSQVFDGLAAIRPRFQVSRRAPLDDQRIPIGQLGKHPVQLQRMTSRQDRHPAMRQGVRHVWQRWRVEMFLLAKEELDEHLSFVGTGSVDRQQGPPSAVGQPGGELRSQLGRKKF